MKKLNPKNYDYLWTDNDVNFIFVSCYLFKEFKKTDFVLIYDYKDKGLKFFLSKKDHKRLSEYGLKFYKNNFTTWKNKTLKNIKIGKQLIYSTKIDKNKITFFDNQQLKNKIKERVNLFQSLGDNYFYSEFFFLDKIELLIQKNPNRYKSLKKKLIQMAKIKYQARNILNSFYNYKIIFKPYIEEVMKRTGRKDLPWLSFSEIYQLINNKNIPLSKRGRINWVLTKSNDWQIITGRQTDLILKKFNHYFFERKIKILKGKTGNPGFYRGRVKIIRTIFSDKIREEIKNFKKGEILVANTTGPEIMIACQNAGAIVTDEGGITSHAVIVSRELNIPCVIGTKIATKVLKDGDLVEVDATKGIVKKIK